MPDAPKERFIAKRKDGSLSPIHHASAPENYDHGRKVEYVRYVRADITDGYRGALEGLTELLVIRDASETMQPLCQIERDRLNDAKAALAKGDKD